MKNIVKVKIYPLVERAVEEGINYGYNRAYKHTNGPDEGVLKEHILKAVMNELCEILDFDGE